MTAELPPVLLVIIASTRPGRAGLPVANWFVEQARSHGVFTIDVVDLAVLNLPLMDEPNHPSLSQYTQQHTKDWSVRVARADAVVLVFPEYNHAFTAPLKNAIDFLNREWAFKPVGFVCYGGVSAGLRAASMLKQVVTALRMMPLFEVVSIPFVRQHITPDGVFAANDSQVRAAVAMLNELHRTSQALKPLRPAL